MTVRNSRGRLSNWSAAVIVLFFVVLFLPFVGN